MMKVGVTGSSGLIGKKLVERLRQQGDEVARIVRGAGSASGEIHWDPARGQIDSRPLESCDAIVHLAGENIGDRRWSAAQKARIRDSRVLGTTLLCQTLAGLNKKPDVLICASAVGFYGDRGDYECDESASSGRGFLPDVCVAWEAATEPALRGGIRVVNLRTGMVLSRDGGALKKMLLPFQLGLGGVVGSGRQYWSWIALDDLVSTIVFCLATGSIEGPVNAVAPRPVTNREFTKTLGRVLHRPTVFPMPAFLARLALGEMANDLLLASTRVVPKRLAGAGFRFEYPELETALRHVLARKPA
jgi:uncharacterized protein (TIGR01777 family)